MPPQRGPWLRPQLPAAPATCHAGCPPGRYFTAGNCADCPVASFCPGGIQNTKTSTATAVATACGTGLTTRTKRSRVAAACTNLPGYRYVAGTTPSAVLCTSNTYSVGFKKQPSCTPCAPGFVIAAAAGLLPAARDNPNDCGASLQTAPSALLWRLCLMRVA